MKHDFCLNPAAFFEETDDGMVIVDPSREHILFLGILETRVFKDLLKQSREQVVKQIHDEYDGETIESDVIAFIHQLQDNDILLEFEMED